MSKRYIKGNVKEIKPDGFDPFFSCSFNLEDLKKLRLDKYGNVRLTIFKRREPDKYGNTHYAVEDERYFQKYGGDNNGSDKRVEVKKDEGDDDLPF